MIAWAPLIPSAPLPLQDTDGILAFGVRAEAMKQMTSADVLEVVALLERNGISVWLDGGWGVDALLGRQTRLHGDLDIAVQHKDVVRLRQILRGRGYGEVPRPDTKAWNFVLGDDGGHEVDVHSYTLGANGEHVYGIEYPADSLTGAGLVGGQAVKCISAEHLVRFHTGNSPRETDAQDVLALCRKFALPLPEAYEGVAKKARRGEHLADVIRVLRPAGRRTAIVAIDGYGGSGKSTLAERIAAALPDVSVIRTDDFAKPNVSGWDWQRMKRQVLDPINRDERGLYQRYDWSGDRLAEWHDVPAGGILIVEGVSSMRRELGRYWDLAIWVTCPHAVRLARGIARDGEAKRSQWENVWIPEEDAYVADQKPDERADVVVSGEARFEL